MKDNFLDKAIGFVSPVRALERSRARIQLQASQKIVSRGYEAAMGGRLSAPRTGSLTGMRASADAEDVYDLPILRERSRDLCRNNPHARKSCAAIVANVIGDGISPRPKTGDDERDRAVNLAFNNWASSLDCDSAGERDFYGLQALACHMMVESGEVLVRKIVKKENGRYRLKIQLLEADYLDDWRNGPLEDGTMVVRGVEVGTDPSNLDQRIAYWLFAQHPGSMPFNARQSLLSAPVKADQILHVYDNTRPVKRGVPFGASSFETIRHLAQYEQAEIVRKTLESASVAFVETVDPNNAIGFHQVSAEEGDADFGKYPPGTFDQYGVPILGFEPGTINYLQPGSNVKFNSPQAVNGYAEYKKSQLQTIAQGFNLPVELMSGDYSDVNFSSSRAVMEEFMKRVKALQQTIIVAKMLKPLWGWFCEVAYLNGDIDDPNIPVDWATPLRPLTNPVDDVAAMRDAIRSGLRSPQSVITEFSGHDWQDVLAESAFYFSECDRLGVVSDNNPGAVSLKGVAQKNDPTGKSQVKSPLDSRQLRDVADEYTVAEQERLYDILREKFRKR